MEQAGHFCNAASHAKLRLFQEREVATGRRRRMEMFRSQVDSMEECWLGLGLTGCGGHWVRLRRRLAKGAAAYVVLSATAAPMLRHRAYQDRRVVG